MNSIDQNLGCQVETIGEVDRMFAERAYGGSRADWVALLVVHSACP